MAQCLVNRGVTSKAEVSEFLNPRLKLLADPFLIPNMDAAVKRLWKARENNERLLIYGDYDGDGVSSTALLVEMLTELGWTVQSHLPGRFDDGYGLSEVSLEKCLEQFKADIVLFNPYTVKTHATKEDPHHYPVGIDYVVVNGRVVVDDGENTGVLPGRALRRGRSTT